MSKDLINGLSPLDSVALLWNHIDWSEELDPADGTRDGYWGLVESIWGYYNPSNTQQNGRLHAWTLWLLRMFQHASQARSNPNNVQASIVT